MNSAFQATTGESLRRRLTLDCIVRWRWGIVMVFLIHMIIALLLLSIDGNEGPPVLILLVAFHMTGIMFFSHDFKNGWLRVLRSLPISRHESNRILLFAALLPAGMWAVTAALVGTVSLICGLGFEKLTPLFSALVYGSAATASTLYFTGGKSGVQGGGSRETGWLLLVLIPAWFMPVGHPAAILFILPLAVIAIVGWRRMERSAGMLQSVKSTLSETRTSLSRGKTGVLKKGSHPVIKWLLQRVAINFFIGCSISAYALWSAMGKPEEMENLISDERLISHVLPVIAAATFVLAASWVQAVKLWRSLPLPENVLTVVLAIAPAGAAAAGILGIIIPPALISGFKLLPSPHYVIPGVLSVLLCFTAAPAALRFQGKNGSQFMSLLMFFIVNIAVSVLFWDKYFTLGMEMLLATFWSAALLVLIFMIIRLRHLLMEVLIGTALGSLALISMVHQNRYPVLALSVALGIAVFGLVWMRHLLSQGEIYRESSRIG